MNRRPLPASGGPSLQRRSLLRALTRAAVAPLLPALIGCGRDASTTASAVRSNLGHVGELQGADGNGLRLPRGFSSRIVARAGARRAGDAAGYAWHAAPDGGAVFVTSDGGWIYVSNSEVDSGRGGVGALRFDRRANVVAQYAICSGTSRNCAGGPTPWGTWLTCEEIAQAVSGNARSTAARRRRCCRRWVRSTTRRRPWTRPGATSI